MTHATQIRLRASVADIEPRLAVWLAQYSIPILRISLGLVFLAFGILKFIPGLSPAEPLAAQTLQILTFGVVPVQVALIGIAALETTIGGAAPDRPLDAPRLGPARPGELLRILSPLVLLPGEMFRGLFAPTLEGQYVLKDVIVAAAGLVIAARTLRARLVVGDQR